MCLNRFIYFDVADDSVRHHRLSSPEGAARRHHIDGTGFPSKCQKSLHFPSCAGVIIFWLMLSCVLITIFSWESLLLISNVLAGMLFLCQAVRSGVFPYSHGPDGKLPGKYHCGEPLPTTNNKWSQFFTGWTVWLDWWCFQLMSEPFIHMDSRFKGFACFV